MSRDIKPNILDVLETDTIDTTDFEQSLAEKSMFSEYLNKDILDIEYFLSIEKDEERLKELQSMLRNKSNLNTISELLKYLEGILKTPPEEFLKSGFTE